MTDYYNKYLKYKTKYLELKNNDMVGGGKDKVLNNKKITLKNITKNNFYYIIELNSGKDNEYVASNSYTIIEAFFNKKIKYVKAIYLDNEPIGLIWFDPINKNEMFVHRFMIDKKYQGKGYGSIFLI
jgi:diamine N-acetyltransferase